MCCGQVVTARHGEYRYPCLFLITTHGDVEVDSTHASPLHWVEVSGLVFLVVLMEVILEI